MFRYSDAPTDLVPATQASVELGYSREVVIRKIQRGELAGRFMAGRWWVDRAVLPPAVNRPLEPAPAT